MPDIYLRSVPSDSNVSDVRLYDPTVANATNYTADLSPATFVYTGSNLDPPIGRFADLSPASFLYTGAALGAVTGYSADLSPASFTLTGSNLGASTGRVADLSPGSFLFTGSDLTAVVVVPSTGKVPDGGGGHLKSRKTLPYGWWEEKLEELKEEVREALEVAGEDTQAGDKASLVANLVKPFQTDDRIDWTRLAETAQQLEELKAAVLEFEAARAEEEDEEALLMLL